MSTVLYPLKFKPIFKDKIWGGRKIKDVIGLDYGKLPNCGEAWLLSGLWDEQSVIANGDFEGDEINDLVETFMGDLVGEGVFDKYGEQFPLLIKIIDANDWLSVQVHPDDELAEKREIGNGKPVEMNDADELFAHPQNGYTKKLIAALPGRRSV